ncbi:MAG: class I SAM-dependent methyltransferase [Steroidobacteraceae bacterium]
MTAPRCPLCNSATTRSLGRIPDGDFFAGRVLPAPLPGGRLWRCQPCESLFRWPVASAAEYGRLYQQGRAEQWSTQRARHDFPLIAAVLVRSAARTVLDVGCGSGEFLMGVPADIGRFGVEPSAAAAAVAAGRGITVLGQDLSQVGAERSFDAIVAIDVIEHLVDPNRMLDEAWVRLSDGGRLLISTGDPQCRAWRSLFGARFWYASFPEHLVFPSGRYLAQWAARRGATLESCTGFNYQDAGPFSRLAGFIMQCAYAASPAVFNAVGRALVPPRGETAAGRRCHSPGIPGTFRDHQLIVLRKAG